MGGWTWTTSRRPIGLDLGTRMARMIQLDQRGGRWSVVAAAQRPMPAELPELSAAEQASALGPILRQMVESAPFRGRRVVSGVAAGTLKCKNVRLPRMPAAELAEAVRWEARDRLGMGEGMIVQHLSAGEVRQGEEVREEVIVLGVEETAVHRQLAALLAAGLRPVALDAVPGALARCVVAQPPAASSVPRVIIDVGFSCTKVLIVRDGRVCFFKLVETGGQKLDQVVAQHLRMEQREAAQLRRRLWSGAEKSGDSADASLFGGGRRESVERAVFEALRSTVAELGREIGLCLRYYSVTFRGGRPEEATLVGGESGEPKLLKVLADETGLNVRPADPLAEVELGRSAELIRGPDGPGAWAVAAGLSARPMPSVPVRLGLQSAAAAEVAA